MYYKTIEHTAFFEDASFTYTAENFSEYVDELLTAKSNTYSVAL